MKIIIDYFCGYGGLLFFGVYFFMTYELKYMTATKVYNYLGISKALFYRVLKNDPTFPKGLEITKGKKVYDKNSIDEWLLSKNSQTNLS